jgi:Cu+-exporting ATPase
MHETQTVTKDPICGMTVDPASARHAERDGKTSYFCSDACKQKFLAGPVADKPAGGSGSCCG